MGLYKTSSIHPSHLPLLPLPHPLVLFPGCRITFSIPRAVALALVDLLRDGENDQALLAVVPLPAKPQDTKGLEGDSQKLHTWGVSAKVVRLVRSSQNSDVVTLQGIARLELRDPPSTPLDPLPLHRVRFPTESNALPDESVWEAFRKSAGELLGRLSQEAALKGTVRGGRADTWAKLADLAGQVGIERAAWVVDVIVGTVGGDYDEQLKMLECLDLKERVKMAVAFLSKQNSISELNNKIANSVSTSLTNAQKAFYLRQQLQAIQRELATLSSSPNSSRTGSPPSPSSDPEASELDGDAEGEEEMADIKKKIEEMVKGSEERKAGVREWKRLKRIPPGSVETGVIRGYLEWLTSLPWPTEDGVAQEREREALLEPDFLANARATLEKDHYGLDKIKRRLVEYLVVLRLKAMSRRSIAPPAPSESSMALVKVDPLNDVPPPLPTSVPAAAGPASTSSIKAPILLLVGPPGTGKTSIASSLARSLRRPFERISLGGVRDEASIRGHRRTYVASGPGMIISALRRAGRRDCVMLLDEIDKLAGRGGVMGDPAAALLEVLDPEQNSRFVDHYLGIPFDLSQVTWIATANTLEGMSAPLLDRCEIISLSSYTYSEKLHIARRYLLPKQLRQNAMPEDKLILSDDVLMKIIRGWTREAGVRELERRIGAVVRWKAVQLSESESGKYDPVVKVEELETILGLGRSDPRENQREEKVGVVWGMVYTGDGEGGLLSVETLKVPGEGKLRLTGSLGDVIKESGEIALSWVKSHAHTLGITAHLSHDPLKQPDLVDIHLHLPEGATKKDGPSAGVAMVCAFVSLLTGRTVPTNIAMTGELTLRGSVAAVGGIKEKVLGAYRAGITKIILPAPNKRDVEQDIPKEVKQDIEFVYVKTVDDVLEAAFGTGAFWKGPPYVESRL